MTSFAPPEVVRCPQCNKLALRQSFRSINFSGHLFPPAFQSIARGDTLCPHCNVAINAHELDSIRQLDTQWERWIWNGLPNLLPSNK